MTLFGGASAADADVVGGEAVVPAHGPRVVWARVALFYGVAFGGIALVAVALALVGGSMRDMLLAVAFGATAMLMPLVAGLVTERVAGRRPLLARGWVRFRAAKARTIGRVVGWSAVGYVVIQGLMLAAAFTLGGVPGMGTWATQAQFDATLQALNPALAGRSTPLALAVGSGLAQAFLAGLTINGLFAFGEEYGWRGVLAEELRPLGVVRANLLTGVVWGLWHAPLIALGHNYGPQWAVGIPLFVLITTPLSFILWWARERSGSVVAPAVVHGAFNGFAGIYLLVLVGSDRLVSLPVGVLSGVVLSVVAALLWLAPGLRPVGSSAPRLARHSHS